MTNPVFKFFSRICKYSMCDGGGIEPRKLRNTSTWSVTFAIELGVVGSHPLGVGRKYSGPIFLILFYLDYSGGKLSIFLGYTNWVRIYPNYCLAIRNPLSIHVSLTSYFRFYTNLERRTTNKETRAFD